MPQNTKGCAGKRLAESAERYIRDHSENKFSLAEIAGALYVNGNYLARQFKKETGHTLLWYHNFVRCEKAKTLLAGKELTVSRVGETVGFVSSAHFSHVFSKMTGMSPSAFRESLPV